ncbi:hypothetical protein [Treponema sp. C6A8]|uniref:hypothetical protein n=1 Tax=Treponema sp. C6A8 TaxID=1410609 RepID=UPI000480978F|nr:hypothetical protein [Treponema sp. C6A8]
MVEFYINGQNVDVQIEDEQTVGDVLKSFEKTCEENEAAVIGISVDGKQITADIFDEEAAKELGKNTKFEFSVVTKGSIRESFENLSVLFTSLSEKMEQVPVALQNGQNSEVVESIKKLADNINEFCHVATLASLFPDTFKEITINGMNFKDFFADFSQILLDFEQALQNNDTVLIGDLSEYEICPRLTAISQALHF